MLATFSWRDFIQPLALFGFAAQFVFMMRFLIQWFVSERRGRSYVPVIFWWISLLGGVMLFVYAYLREDLVIMAGQLLGSVIYARNLMLIYRRQARMRDRLRRGFAVVPAAPEVESAAAARPPGT